MNLEQFIQKMPKAELNIRLEGAYRPEALLSIAEQNDIPDTFKKFKHWVDLLHKPDYPRLDALIKTTNEWLRHPDDITRLVYDVGVSLSKQQVRYAEIHVNPMLYLSSGLSFDNLLAVLNDGRDRVERGWGVQMRWILSVSRSEPRHADEISRWAAGAVGRKAGVVGFSVIGDETAQPLGQFVRAFNTAHKKELPGFLHAGDKLGAETILEALEILQPARILHGWGTADAPDVLDKLSQAEIPVLVSMSHALCYNLISRYADYPLQRLYSENIKLILSADMPLFYKSSLNDEYLAAVEHCNLTLDQLEELALNGLYYSMLPEDEKITMMGEFTAEYAELRTQMDVTEAN